jgi:cell division protein FtsB
MSKSGRFAVLVGVMLLCLLLMLKQLLLSGSGLWAIHRLSGEIAGEMQKNQDLQTRNRILLAKVVELKTGDQSIESRARSELGLVKQNEIFYQIVNS